MKSQYLEGGGGVNTLTGSVGVAAPQSNTLISDVRTEEGRKTVTDAMSGTEENSTSLPGARSVVSSSVPDAKPGTEECEVPEDSLREAKPSSKMNETHAHPISHPEECPNAPARIGLVPTDEVGPKKPKTGESQQPGPATGHFLGVMRGVGGPPKQEGGIPSLQQRGRAASTRTLALWGWQSHRAIL